MLIKLDELIKKHQIPKCGVLHVGAHIGEELVHYKREGWFPVYWIEGDNEVYKKLKENIKEEQHHYALNRLISNKRENVTFNISNNKQSSSILELGTHKKEHPEIFYTKKIKLQTTTIDLLQEENDITPCEFLVLDIQGAELLALEGAEKYLKSVKYIYSEVNLKELYVGCALLPQIDDFLNERGFTRVDTLINEHMWGDAFWIKI